MQIPNEQDFNMVLHMLLSELLDLEAFIICCRVMIAYIRDHAISDFFLNLRNLNRIELRRDSKWKKILTSQLN